MTNKLMFVIGIICLMLILCDFWNIFMFSKIFHFSQQQILNYMLPGIWWDFLWIITAWAGFLHKKFWLLYLVFLSPWLFTDGISGLSGITTMSLFYAPANIAGILKILLLILSWVAIFGYRKEIRTK